MNHYSFVGSCLVSSVHSRYVQSTRKEQNNNHKVVAERWLLQEEEDRWEDNHSTTIGLCRQTSPKMSVDPRHFDLTASTLATLKHH